MSSSKRTATQAQLPMPTAKRASTSRTSGSSERALVAPMPTEDQAQGDWVAEWASPVLVKGREALYSTAHAICVMAYNWWTKPILPTTHRPTRNIPSRSTRRPSETNVSPPRPPRQDENPSDSSGQASPPTPQPSGIIPPPPTGVTDYGPFIPQPPPREFAIPKMEVAEKMTAPIVKTDAMRMAEESERRQKVNSDWVRDFQRRRRNEQALEASFGEPGAIRKAFKRPHIFQAEHEARVKDALMKHLYKQSIDEGYGADYETFKDYVSYKERLASSTGSLKASNTPSVEDPFTATASMVYSESSFRRTLKMAREAAMSRPPVDHFGQWFKEYMKRTRDELAHKEEARIQALTKKSVPKDLTEEEKAEVARVMKKSGVINECGKETVTQDSIQRLRGTTWLNDELVNFYGAMVQQRADERLKAAGGKPGEGGKDLPGGKGRALDIHVFSSFFYSKLTTDGYAKGRIGRWTKKFDIFKKDKIIFPMNIGGMHWTTGCIDFRKKRIEWYNSLPGSAGDIFEELRKYLDLEHRDKRKKSFDFTGWANYRCPDYPQQQNGSDCGVFTALGMEALARDADFNFEQDNIPFFRRLMVLEIGRAKLSKIPTRED